MKLKISTLYFIYILCSTISYAQWEFTIAGGVNYEQLSLNPPLGASLEGYQESTGKIGFLVSGQVGYRLNEKWALRTRVAATERSQQKGSLFTNLPNSNVATNYIDLTVEGAYYFNPYFSIAVGASPAFNTGQTLSSINSFLPVPDFIDFSYTNQAFARGGIALEGHLRNFDARLEQTFGLSNARNDELQFTDLNGTPLGPTKGTWSGVMLTVGYRFMLGKERYNSMRSIDGFFRKLEDRFQEKNPRLAMDIGYGVGLGFLSPDVLFATLRREYFNRSGLALRIDYLLKPKLSAISAFEFGQVSTDVDNNLNSNSTIEKATSLGMRAGLRYQPIKMLGASIDIASARLFNRKRVDGDLLGSTTPLPLAPLRNRQLLGSVTGYFTYDRWEAFGRVSYTLTQPYTKALDSRFGTPVIRQNRISDFQAGINYRIFRRAS